MKFEQSLKNMRRHIYLYGAAWRTAVIAPDKARLNAAFDEAKFLIETSSLGLQMARYQTMTIQTEKDAIIRFFPVADSLEAYVMRGMAFTQMIFIGDNYDYNIMGYFRSLLRSDSVCSDDWLFQTEVIL